MNLQERDSFPPTQFYRPYAWPRTFSMRFKSVYYIIIWKSGFSLKITYFKNEFIGIFQCRLIFIHVGVSMRWATYMFQPCASNSISIDHGLAMLKSILSTNLWWKTLSLKSSSQLISPLHGIGLLRCMWSYNSWIKYIWRPSTHFLMRFFLIPESF